MRMMFRSKPVLALLAAAAMGAAAYAEESPSVTVSGSASVIAPPTQLRVTLVVAGTGKDVREAVTDLRKQLDQSKAKFEALKPIEGTLLIGEPTTADAALSPMARQQQMMMRRMRGPQPKPPEAAPKITANATVTASFELPAGTGDDALIAHHELQKKIQDAVSIKGKTLTPEEQEAAEEAQMDMGGGMPAAEPGKATFSYVLQVSPDAAAKLAKDAMAAANRKATALAAAAGMKVGGIQTLSYGDGTPANAMMRAYLQAMSRTDSSGNADTEATSDAPGPITYDLELTVVYTLQK